MQKTSGIGSRSGGICVALCIVSLMSIPILTTPYRRDIDSATPLSMMMYQATWVMELLLLLVLLTRQFHRWRLLKWVGWLPLLPVLAFVAKWLTIIFGNRLNTFHGGMGLGQEILGPIPNLAIDLVICLPLLLLFWAVWILVKRSQ